MKSSEQAFTFNRMAADEAAKRQFAETGRLRISDWLGGDGAQRLAAELEQSDSWREVLNAGEQSYEIDRAGQEALSASDRERIKLLVQDAARHGFQYRYETIRVPDDPLERDLSSSHLTLFARFMSSPEVLSYLAEITGLADIDFADAQATSYRAGDFLTGHHDAVEGKNRRAAYVLSLSPKWRTEWGGLLMFHSPDGTAGDYLVPQFNTLNLFAVPQMHSVSQVATFAANPRRSITGWLRASRD